MAGTPSAAGQSSHPPSLKKSSSSKQTSIAGFFQKKPATAGPNDLRVENALSLPVRSSPKKKVKRATLGSDQSITPAPSSDQPEPVEDETKPSDVFQEQGSASLPSPVTPAGVAGTRSKSMARKPPNGFYSPSRKAKKVISYAESGDEDEDDILNSNASRRPSKRRKTSIDSEDDNDEFGVQPDEKEDVDSEEDFVVPDESDDEATSKKRKRSKPKVKKGTSKSRSLSPPSLPRDPSLELPEVSTAQTWRFDPDGIPSETMIKHEAPNRKPVTDVNGKKMKPKAHASQPEERYEWLGNMHDADRNPPGHPDHDPRTIYIPPKAWAQFSPFEAQYWKIKAKFMDTIVFFKKGKFYELYEQDATIGHQLFDLKLTDRVNMRMVGVPEMSLPHWANQFVAAGYKIARVDQQESALSKEMRERDGQGQGSKTKVIERKLACVLTGGTLVDGAMLQDDMSTFCVSIKEEERDGLPSFGISYVDAATGQFNVTEFADDTDFTKFETFIAQVRPQEIILEKGFVTPAANRIIKNNTSPTTIRNELKPGKEFWTADTTWRELDAGKYFVSEEGDDQGAWPKVLKDVRERDLLMSSFGALIQYLRTLQIERELLTLGNINWYDPIRKANSLVLDGKTLINLEIFANNFDGGSDGTLFALLNRCITPFGKRLFKQWVCHPLMDAVKINARLDAVDAMNADTTVKDRFTSELSKLPDLERMISRIHARSCKPQDFVKVLNGFEQIDYTMGIVRDAGSGEGIIGQLIAAMPNMKSILLDWKDLFDHDKAKEHGLLIPERGVEEDFDESQDRIDEIKKRLENHLKKVRKDLGSTSIVFRDNGKEIYQLEVPVKVKGVPKGWDQMSATQQVKRYYNNELRALVRSLQEAQETHAKIVKEVTGRFFARFDEHYTTWLAAVNTIAHLDCLISLAKASCVLGEPSCRPTFLAAPEGSRSTISFSDLRHPCMLGTVTDFIPNDVSLGGSDPNISLLTGANAAGKSTILRMTCVAVIMAQLGCYVPATAASLTPVDRIMSRLGANDNIFAAQSTFFVELTETKKILSEASPRSLVILDELGRGTSSYDGVAVAEAVLHHIATHIGCVGFFATHYHSLATEFARHPEVKNKRMRIHVDEAEKRVTFLYKLEDGVAEGSFGMHCASMCGIPGSVVERAEVAAREWEHTSKLQERMGERKQGWVPLGWGSDVAWMLREKAEVGATGLDVLRKAIEGL
ncbi:uncharacterized protein KY384_001837 [Bacidia gigantensis]|uniref:uncharacterized protein n=1 Tax=Bacidia gigantensis TaxID=2732470 RepID=UPI001D043E96|nr:uncharacterized protein KY384_001837 [Bacidia gigantensis]KAG8533054.1 hypothetical protein KY384_001837 [Bacidia gigantensis]